VCDLFLFSLRPWVQGLSRLRRKSTSPHDLHRYRAGQHVEILYVPQRMLGAFDVGHLAVLVKESPADPMPPTTFGLYGKVRFGLKMLCLRGQSAQR